VPKLSLDEIKKSISIFSVDEEKWRDHPIFFLVGREKDGIIQFFLRVGKNGGIIQFFLRVGKNEWRGAEPSGAEPSNFCWWSGKTSGLFLPSLTPSAYFLTT
jgi:hypothetical protein